MIGKYPKLLIIIFFIYIYIYIYICKKYYIEYFLSWFVIIILDFRIRKIVDNICLNILGHEDKKLWDRDDFVKIIWCE